MPNVSVFDMFSFPAPNLIRSVCSFSLTLVELEVAATRANTQRIVLLLNNNGKSKYSQHNARVAARNIETTHTSTQSHRTDSDVRIGCHWARKLIEKYTYEVETNITETNWSLSRYARLMLYLLIHKNRLCICVWRKRVLSAGFICCVIPSCQRWHCNR